MRLFCALLLSTTALMAEPNLNQRVSLLESKMKKIREESAYPCRPGARFATGRPVTTGCNVSTFGEALYWKFYEGGSDFAVSNTATLPLLFGKMEPLNYDWKTGYRVGASWGFTSAWDITASFTHIAPEARKQLQAPAGGELISLAPPFVIGSAVFAQQFLNYSILNVEIGSSTFASKSFYLRPHYGAEGAWIHQRGTKTPTTSVENNFNGGGIRCGFDSKWFIQRNVSFVCNVSGAGLYGRFTSKMNEGGILINGNTNRIVPAAQTLLGLCWEANFADDRSHIALLAAYEANYWWRQNQLVRLESSVGTLPYGTRFSEDLGSQGLSVNLSLFF